MHCLQLGHREGLFLWQRVGICPKSVPNLSRVSFGNEGRLRSRRELEGEWWAWDCLWQADTVAIFSPRCIFVLHWKVLICCSRTIQDLEAFRRNFLSWKNRVWNYQGTPVSCNQDTKSGKVWVEIYPLTWSLNLNALKYPKASNQNGTI